jgi:hypothetical protein
LRNNGFNNSLFKRRSKEEFGMKQETPNKKGIKLVYTVGFSSFAFLQGTSSCQNRLTDLCLHVYLHHHLLNDWFGYCLPFTAYCRFPAFALAVIFPLLFLLLFEVSCAGSDLKKSANAALPAAWQDGHALPLLHLARIIAQRGEVGEALQYAVYAALARGEGAALHPAPLIGRPVPPVVRQGTLGPRSALHSAPPILSMRMKYIEEAYPKKQLNHPRMNDNSRYRGGPF